MLAYHITLSNRIFHALSSLLKCVFCLLQNCARYTSNAIGHCIVYFVFDMLISLRLKIQSLSLLWSPCENFRPLAEAKCHTLWKMIVKPTQDLNPRTTITPAALTDQRSLTCYWHQTKDSLVSMSNRTGHMVGVSHTSLRYLMYNYYHFPNSVTLRFSEQA